VITLDWNAMTATARDAALARPEQRCDAVLQAAVRAIVGDVRTGGWDALVAQAERIDGAAPSLPSTRAASRPSMRSRR
jgi:histidinol dehydrogenase